MALYKRLYHNSFILFAVLILAAFAVIILVASVCTSQPSLLIAVFGLANGIGAAVENELQFFM
jgi:hypothetical protein